MITTVILIQLAIVFTLIFIGARTGGIGLGYVIDNTVSLTLISLSLCRLREFK